MSTYYPQEPEKHASNQPPNPPIDPYGNNPTIPASQPFVPPPQKNPPSQPFGHPSSPGNPPSGPQPRPPYGPQPSQPYGAIQRPNMPIPTPQYQQYPGGNMPPTYPPPGYSPSTPLPVTNPNVNYTNPASYGMPPAPPPRSKNKWLLISLIVLVILVSLGAIFIPYEKTQIDNANATATVSTHQTSVARDATGTVTTQNAHATGTAQANASATAAVVTANPNPYLPNQGTLVAFNKTLDTSWTNNGPCSIKNGAFNITNSAKETVYYCTGGPSYDNFVYDIQMTILQGDCGGIVFRMDATEGHKYYMFNVCQNGYYSVDANQGAALQFITLKSGDMAPGVHTGLKSINQIGVVARGPNLSLYVNTQLVASLNDTSYGSGQLGVVAWDAANPTTISFANERVWKL